MIQLHWLLEVQQTWMAQAEGEPAAELACPIGSRVKDVIRNVSKGLKANHRV